MNLNKVNELTRLLGKAVELIGLATRKEITQEYVDTLRVLTKKAKELFEIIDMDDEFQSKGSLQEASFFVRTIDSFVGKRISYYIQSIPEWEELDERQKRARNNMEEAGEPLSKIREKMCMYANISEMRYDIKSMCESFATEIEKLKGLTREGEKAVYHIPCAYSPLIEILYQNLCSHEITDISMDDFCGMIEIASMSELSVKKAPTAYTIYILGKLMGADWYNEAAKSIGRKKKYCSGAGVEEWMKVLRDDILLKKEKIDKNKTRPQRPQRP